MTPEKLIEAAETLGWITESLNDLTEQKEQANIESLYCSMARLFCLDLAKSMMNSPDDHYAALLKVVSGTNDLTDPQQTLAKIFFSRGAADT